MTSKKLKNLKIAFYKTMGLYNQYKDDNLDGLNLVPLDFECKLEENGFYKLPNGLIIQWGKTSTNKTFNYPIAFPNKCIAVSKNTINAESNETMLYMNESVYNVTNTSLKLGDAKRNYNYLIIVIGY